MDQKKTMTSRVLSISSSVVYGYVGNKCITFTLQLRGFDVDPINTVQLSNHTGYEHFSGSKATGQELAKLMEGIRQNKFLEEYTHLITGYIGSVSFLNGVADVIQSLKEVNPNLQYVCDPVMGDDGKLYVPEEFVEIYRERIVPFADIVTPNQTEAELLTGIKIDSKEKAFEACKWFHKQGVSRVIITTICLNDGFLDVVASDLLISGCDITSATNETCDNQPSAPAHYWHMSIPLFPTYFSGTGDLTAALLLANLNENSLGQSQAEVLKSALESTMASVNAVLQRTYQAESKEILLIQSRNDLVDPEIKFSCKKIMA